MNPRHDFLHVKDSEIINGGNEIVRLRGFCLGGWLNLENFIIGYPGHESGMRTAIGRVLGDVKARFFFESFLHHFIAEEDLCFIKSLGCNVIRIPFNYRHFESDDRPFEYKPEGFALLEKVIGWARTHQLYVILDLHAVQGWQNRGWHCDNPAREAPFWGQKVFEDRAVRLWEELARRYRNEPVVAGYDVMNEPDADDVLWLNHFYSRVITAIRAIDTNHILFLEGNRYSQQFESFDSFLGENIVFSSHNYVEPGLSEVEYPGEIGGKFYDRKRLEAEYLERTGFMLQHGVPNWVGEFGCIFTGGKGDVVRLRVLADMLDIIEKYNHHWTIWNYKDIGRMGMLYLDNESEWMRRTSPIREAKTALRCDSWVERHKTQIDQPIQYIASYVREVVKYSPFDDARLEEMLDVAIRDTALSQALLPAFAEQFHGMNENEIDQMMESFAFHNCKQRGGLVQLISEQLAKVSV